MTKRFFAVTDGTRTVFRASATRVYKSGNMAGSFSGLASLNGYFPATEIDADHYKTLVALKFERLEAAGKSRQYANGPRESWVYNVAIAQAEGRA